MRQVYESDILLPVKQQKVRKLNQLQQLIPEGSFASVAWLAKHGYSTSRLARYAASGWLESPARGVYRRPGSPLKWQQVVVSLDRELAPPPHVGGLSALELRGYAHFLKPRGPGTIHLYSNEPLRGWVGKLSFKERFVEHRNRLFAPGVSALVSEPWGPRDEPLFYSLPERAMLEFLDGVPVEQSLEHAALLMEGLVDLSSKRVMELLVSCRSVKVKRLFLALASRHSFQWVKPVLAAADEGKVNLGKGKRSLVRGGKLHPKYLITVPETSDVRG